jgi:hypothetical protein
MREGDEAIQGRRQQRNDAERDREPGAPPRGKDEASDEHEEQPLVSGRRQRGGDQEQRGSRRRPRQ